MSEHRAGRRPGQRPEVALASAPAQERRPARRRRARQGRLTGLLRLLVFLLLIFAAVWAGVRVANASGDSQAFEGARYEVRARDTLWSIAAAHYDCDADLRELVYDIQRRNDLSGGLLLPGQEILLPFNDHGPLAQTP